MSRDEFYIVLTFGSGFLIGILAASLARKVLR